MPDCRFLFLRFPNEATRNLARSAVQRALPTVPYEDMSLVADQLGRKPPNAKVTLETVDCKFPQRPDCVGCPGAKEGCAP